MATKSKAPRIGNAGDPFDTSEFVIIGNGKNQCSAADMLAAYRGNALAQAVINEVIDTQRTKKPPTIEFIRTLRNGVTTPIVYVNLGPSVEPGHPEYNITVDGRNRLMGLDEVNEERAAEAIPRAPLGIRAMRLDLPRDTAEAVALVRDVMIKGNNVVAMSPSSKADRAAKLSRAGESTKAIAHQLMIREEVADVEIPGLLALAKCVEPIQDAIDSGALRSMAGILAVSEKTDAEQEEWLANKLAPKGERVTRGYAVPASFHASAAKQLAAVGEHKIAAVLTWLADPTPEAFAALGKAVQSGLEQAGYNATTGRIRRAAK